MRSQHGISLFVFCICLVTSDVNALVYLRGAGASFPSEVYKVWQPMFESSRQRFVDLFVDYRSIGSGAGHSLIKGEAGTNAEAVEYVGSDSLLSEVDYANHPNLQMLPTMAGAVVLAFDLPGIYSLNLTREIVVGIYNGTYRFWNDSAIQDVNPGITLPSEQIIPLARADKSGTTELFTSALSSFSSDWASTYGVFTEGLDADDMPSNWSESVIKLYAHKQLGMMGLLLSIRYTIGYLSLSGATQTSLTFADIFNVAGNLVRATKTTVQNAMDDMYNSMSSRLTSSLVDAPGLNSYPISGYTYFIISLTHTGNCESRIELYRYIEWLGSNPLAHTACENQNMTSVSPSIFTKIKDRVLSKMQCNGQGVETMVKDQKHSEALSQEIWRTPVAIAAPILAVLLGSLMAYIIWQQIKLNRAILYDEWKIRSDDIKLADETKRRNISSLRRSVRTITSSPSSHCSMGEEVNLATTLNKIGRWGENTVELRRINLNTDLRRKSKKAILWMRDSIIHENVLKVYGITEIGSNMFFVSDFCSKGQLRDILHNDMYKLDLSLKFSLATDVVSGMMYLHDAGIVHGQLTSETCNIDTRWNVKIADWEMFKFRLTVNPATRSHQNLENAFENSNHSADRKLWRAPELLRSPNVNPTKAADVYSFGILITEIFTRSEPYSEQAQKMESAEIIDSVLNKNLRPSTENLPMNIRPILKTVLVDVPTQRPTFNTIKKVLKEVNPSKKSVLDCMMDVIDGYVQNLEVMIDERTAELAVAMRNMENLLHKLLPPSVADKLSKGEPVPAESYDSVTIFFSDIVGFTSLSAKSTPLQIVDLLNTLYSKFDEAIDKRDVYKVETIGDAYMVISGLPTRNGDRHAAEISDMALEFIQVAQKCKVEHLPEETLRLRAGIHSGPVAAGVVGVKMPRYCLFGDTVNTASRMESTSEAMKVQISQTTHALLKDLGKYQIKSRGEVEVKGKGIMKTFWLSDAVRTVIPQLQPP